MRGLLCIVLLAPAAWGQVAVPANRNYVTHEGRERMIQTLGDESRPANLKMDELVAAIGVEAGSTVVDVGTGAGAMLPFLSKAVDGSGKVIAEDIYQDFLDAAKENATKHGLTNVEFVLGTEKDPKIPAGSADLALIVDAYHHFNYPAEMLAGIHRGLKPGGRLVVVDYYKAGFRDPAHIRLDKVDVVREIASHGFRLLSNHDHIPGIQYRLEFRTER